MDLRRHSEPFLSAWARSGWLTLTPIFALALALRVYDLDAATLWGDERHDVRYSLVHAQFPNPFSAPRKLYLVDPSQARLPFYLTALAVRLISGGDVSTFENRAGQVDGSGLLGWATVAATVCVSCLLFAGVAPRPLGRWAGLLPLGCVFVMMLVLGRPRFPVPQLVAARAVAGVVGAFGVLAAYALAREIADHWAGLFAAACLAFCPTHIGWSRCAVTTGDTFVTTFFVLALWLLYRSIRHGSGRSVMACAASFGLALGAKFSAVLLWPVCFAYAVFVRLARIAVGRGLRQNPPRARLIWASVIHVGLVVPLLLVFFWEIPFGTRSSNARFLLWLAVLVAYVIGLIWSVRSPWWLAQRHLGWMVLSICSGGIVVAALATPYHMRTEVVSGLAGWLREDAAPTLDVHRHVKELSQLVGLPLVQAKMPVNVLALVGLVTLLRRRNLGWSGLLVITAVIYFAAVAEMRHKFLYYLMPMLVLVHVLGGRTGVVILRALWARGRIAAGVFGGVLLVSFAVQAYRTVRLHPYYLLDDRPWERTVSHRPEVRHINLMLQPVRPAIDWLVENAARGSRVACIFPGSMARFPLFSGWVENVLAYELQRLPEDEARRVIFEVPLNPYPLDQWDYVVFFPLPWGEWPVLHDFELVREIRLNEEPAARVFRRWRKIQIKDTLGPGDRSWRTPYR